MTALALVLLTIFMQQCNPAQSSATVEFRFQSWSNPDQNDLSGSCCDPGWSSCSSSCDNYFILCLDEDIPGTNDFNDCGIRSVTTAEVYADNDEFDFPSPIPDNIANPQVINVATWQGRMKVKLNVRDKDGIGDDEVEKAFKNVYQSSSTSQSSAQWVEYTMGTHTIFTFRVKVYCNSDFYSADCSVYCFPTDNQNGHYTCDPTTGAKICYDGWEGIDCNEDKDECQSGPCLHGATCLNGMNQFSCICTEGWTGPRCDVDVNECETNPCYNNGTCNDFPGFFNCSCDPAFKYVGDLCERDDCADYPCLNGSTCIDLVGNFSCVCALGFEGDLCNVDIDECVDDPCENGGNCTQGLGWFNCTCQPGFEGDFCDTDIDECQSNPCFNGSTCEDLTNRFLCHCPVGFEGTNCANEIDECATDPCQHNSTCIDYLGYFECTCTMGFFGDLCEVDIDYCINQTCANNGTCVDRIEGFHCLCQMGFEGAMCDIETDECAEDPCMHNATCLDFIAHYRCICKEGYEGVNCEDETDDCLSNPCRNNSTCLDQLAGFHCQCTAGFEGALCDIDTDECQSFPCYDNETCVDIIDGYRCVDGIDMCVNHSCQNDATCHDDDRGSGFNCVCSPGYEGNYCEYEKNECDSSPCLYGTCEDLVNGFSCQCSPGYQGDRCENDTDDCANTPCKHGKCVDLVNGFICVCTVECVNGHCEDGACLCVEGFEGEDCSEQTDYCRSSPCSKGTCVPLFNSFRCECDPLYEGDYCDSLIDDPCSVSPCKNGQCSPSSDETDGFHCSCPDGFWGHKCDIALKDYGCVLLLIGIFNDVQDFEKNMAALLQMLKTSAFARMKNNITVELVKTEDYIRSDTGEPLTRVTFVAMSRTDFLPKTEVERTVKEAPSDEVKGQLGYEVYYGKAEPKLITDNNTSWAASHWYVILLVVLVIVATLMIATVIAGVKIRNAKRSLLIKQSSKEPIHEHDGYYNAMAELGLNNTRNQTDAASADTEDYADVNGIQTEYVETAISNVDVNGIATEYVQTASSNIYDQVPQGRFTEELTRVMEGSD